MAKVNILGVPHSYELTPATGGSAPVLVFIHGWLLSRKYWQPLIDLLALNYQCLSYDLRGFGDSQALKSELIDQGKGGNFTSELLEGAFCWDSNYTPSAYARDLDILLKHLNISNAWLIGHSLGGSIALWEALQMPGHVKGVIGLNTGGGIYLKEAFERFRAAGEQLLKWRPSWLYYLPGIDLVFARANVARPLARYWGRQRVLDFVTADLEAALGTLLDSTTEAEVNRLPQVVSQLKQPVYFITGARDVVMEPKYVCHLASFHPLFQGCEDNVFTIPNCGHLAMLEQPEAVANQILALLSRHECGQNFGKGSSHQ